jgi:hypothetical protein
VFGAKDLCQPTVCCEPLHPCSSKHLRLGPAREVVAVAYGCATHGEWCYTRTVPMRCPWCTRQVFWFTCEHGCSVWFDALGGAWPEHICPENPDTADAYSMRALTVPAGFVSINRLLPDGAIIEAHGQITSWAEMNVSSLYPPNTIGWRILSGALGGTDLVTMSVVEANRFIFENILYGNRHASFRPSHHVRFSAEALELRGVVFLVCDDMERVKPDYRPPREGPGN